MELNTQKYKYDCGVATVYNLLKKHNIEIHYTELEKLLQTTKLWGTFPKKLGQFFQDLKQLHLPSFGILLVDEKKFYVNDTDTTDYGHYVNIISKQDEKYEIFDPYDGKKYFFTLEELQYFSQNVLVGKTTRYNGVIFGNNFDIDFK